jgi:hypothetical protein
MSATRTDVERQAFAAGVAVGVERAVTAYAPLVALAQRIVALAPGEVEADQVLQRVAAGVRRLQDGEA